jgi:hypothetical protein
MFRDCMTRPLHYVVESMHADASDGQETMIQGNSSAKGNPRLFGSTGRAKRAAAANDPSPTVLIARTSLELVRSAGSRLRLIMPESASVPTSRRVPLSQQAGECLCPNKCVACVSPGLSPSQRMRGFPPFTSGFCDAVRRTAARHNVLTRNFNPKVPGSRPGRPTRLSSSRV